MTSWWAPEEGPAMQLSPSAHVDTFCRDNLPSPSQRPDLLFTLPGLAYPDRLNCAEVLLDKTIERHGAGRPCLLSDGDTWSYGDLRRHADQVARVLTEDFGVVPGNRVLLRGPNTPWLAACWLGAVKSGAVVVTTMALLRSAELTAICEIAQVRLALCDSRLTGELAAAGVPGIQLVGYGGDGPDDLVQRAAAKPAGFTAVATAADDVAMIAFTSGTTGRPKAAMHFHREVLAIADTFSARVLRPTPDDIFTGTPPFAFTFGLGGLLIFPLHAGAATLLLERAAPAELADHIAARGVTVCFTAPTAYRAMLAAGKAGQLRGLRRPVSAGEHLSAATWQAFYDATGVRIIDGIGSTELLHIFISAADQAIKPGSTGVPSPRFRPASRGGSQSRGPPAVSISPMPGSGTTCRMAGTSPATPTSATATGTSGTRPARTTSSSPPATTLPAPRSRKRCSATRTWPSAGWSGYH